MTWLATLKEAVRTRIDIRYNRFCNWKPTDDRLSEAKWLWSDEEGWYEVCSFCGGNCGQCGMMRRFGNRPYSLQQIVTNGGWDKGNHAGLVGSPGDLARIARKIGL